MRFPVSVICALLFAQSVPAFAALGAAAGPAAGVAQAAGASAKVSARVTSYNGYSVSEVVEPSGTTVREYIGADNVVFAVSWQGPSMPNLQQLLGSYADQYVSAASEPHAGRRAVAIQSDQLVLRSGGHMRSFAGSAYVPALLPQGVTPDNIR
ncbi:DUF2844 domain-containing protein [Collimonas sp.]|jgi:hypothetical protein|uniref:DUF2844 domain-containing protein n=1 Tax=Collimonas sp. TaxID=1963772 RepID=UPI002BE86BB6|nr:DUF2844 domain-containing protein [Collimonas sp.]HWW04414.1 DUF2844 domain-containing protein [Collimonas sp.]